MGKEQKSAIWTFRNRRGTCDEIAHLFIALARAAGLNARYVAGYALGDTGWLPHAWAEVYTEFGWLPFDVPFEEYGAVDALHIITYRGRSGDHEFIRYRYTGDVEINYEPEIKVLDKQELDISGSLNATNAYSGGDVLLVFSAYNPLDSPIAFPVKFGYPEGFHMEKIYGSDVAVLYPGKNTLFYVFRVQEIPENTIYQVPITLGIGEFFYATNFTVYSYKKRCGVPELVNGGFLLDNCINLHNGMRENFTYGGDYFCDCYLHLPQEINFSIFHPEVCYAPCNVTVELRGIGYANVSAPFTSLTVPVKGYTVLELGFDSEPFFVEVNGKRKYFNLTLLPNPQLEYALEDGEVCFSSLWNLSRRCYRVKCGENEITVEASYGNVTFKIKRKVYRKCSVFETVLEKLITLLNSLLS